MTPAGGVGHTESRPGSSPAPFDPNDAYSAQNTHAVCQRFSPHYSAKRRIDCWRNRLAAVEQGDINRPWLRKGVSRPQSNVTGANERCRFDLTLRQRCMVCPRRTLTPSVRWARSRQSGVSPLWQAANTEIRIVVGGRQRHLHAGIEFVRAQCRADTGVAAGHDEQVHDDTLLAVTRHQELPDRRTPAGSRVQSAKSSPELN